MASKTPLIQTPWAAVAGLFAGAVGAAINQQALADVLYWNCAAGGLGPGLAVGALAALFTLGGGWSSWRAHQAAGRGPDATAQRFLSQVGLGSAGIFLLAIAAQTLAGVIVPACHR